MAFKYIPAGVVPSDVLVNIYVKYGKYDTKEVTWTYDKELRKTTIVTPDRKIWLVRYTDVTEKQFIPEDFDEYLSGNPYEYNSVPSSYCDLILFSAHNAKGYNKKKRSEWKTQKGLNVVVDSGGFQLRAGTARYVSPFKNIAIYNNAADIAMGLDIPPRPADKDDVDAMKILAVAQKKNNEIFKEHVTDTREIKFLNPIHGFSLKDMKDWLKIVDDEFFKGYGVAISEGKFAEGNEFKNILAIFLPVLEGKVKNPHIHVFGVSGKKIFPVLAWLGRYMDITSDSSQHIHTAIRGKIFENFTPDGKIVQYRMGDENLTDKKGNIRINTIDFTSQVEIPCGCQLCNRLKYSQIYTLPANTGASSLLSIHNMISNLKISSWWNEQAQKLTLEQYEKLVKEVRPKDAKDIISMCRFIDLVKSKGIDYVEKKYSHKTNKEKKLMASDMDSLFSTKKLKKKAAMENLDYLESSVVEVLPNYMDYDELSHIITKPQYIDCKLNTIWEQRFQNNKKNKMTFAEFCDKYTPDISLKGHEFLLSELVKKDKKNKKEKKNAKTLS